MPSPRSMRQARRVTQGLSLALFLWLLLSTFYHGVVEAGGEFADTLPYPVSIFLQIDPLVALSSFLATGSLYADLVWALPLAVLTLFLGRWFCGWLCPFGTIHNFFSEVATRKRRAVKKARNKTGRHQVIKYGVLVFFLGSALAGTLVLAALDPLCFAIRSLGLSILPAADAVVRRGAEALPRGAGEAIQQFLDQNFLGPQAHRFHGGSLIGGLFVVVVALNRVMPRFWCRVLCPLGALLGLLSRFSLFGLHKHEPLCKDCDLCLHACQGAASPEHGVKWKAAECFVCYNCVAACPASGGLEFKFGIQKPATDSTVDLSRRGFVTSALVGVATVPLLRSARHPERDPLPLAIRPPGSCDEEEFLERCIRCGQCMKVCPNNAIHPALTEAGLEGFWSPVILPKIGYCEPTCTLCSKVCPTGAIRPFTEEDKKANRVKIGTGFFDHGRCLPWAMGTNCIVCEEFCPTSPKSIWFEKVMVADRDGHPLALNRPYVDASICTGCGVCEKVCPVADQAAIRVTSVGESRSAKNRILLRESKSQAR
ncbi:MAG: 4Fe-4S binding protein [Planctomycetota bacterium]